MSSDYIPGKDLDLQVWLNRFMTYVAANLAHFGLVAADIAALQAAEPEFAQARMDAEDALTTYHTTTDAKNAKRAEIVGMLRPLVAHIQANQATTNVDRDAMHIPKRGEPSMVPAAVGTSVDRPFATVSIGQILKHTLRVQNQNGEIVVPGKPAGVRAVEVWVKVGESPVDTDEMKYVDTSTRNTLTVPFEAADGNKQAHYKMRWVYSGGGKGNWSETVSATIAA